MHRILAAKKLLAIFEMGFEAYTAAHIRPDDIRPLWGNLGPTRITLRGVIDALSAANESYFLRTSLDPISNTPAPINLPKLTCDIDNGVVVTLDALHVALDVIIDRAVISNPDPDHPIHFAAIAFRRLMTYAVADARKLAHPFVPVSLASSEHAVDCLALRGSLDRILKPVIASALTRLYLNNLAVGLPARYSEPSCCHHTEVMGQPADLKAILARLEHLFYYDLHSFANDVSFIFSNTISCSFDSARSARLDCVQY